MITVCQLHTDTCIQDATAWIPDQTSAFSRVLPAAGTDVQSTSELYNYILYLYCQFMGVWNAPPRLLKPWPSTRFYVKRLIWQLCNHWFCWQLRMYCFFHVMLNSWCCNYVITDFVNNYVCITFFLGIIMYVIVIILFSFACIMHFVRELIEIIFKDFARRNFELNLYLRKGECKEGIICGYKMCLRYTETVHSY